MSHIRGFSSSTESLSSETTNSISSSETYSTIVPSSLLVTPAHPRPSPQIFGLHGLRGSPIWSRQTQTKQSQDNNSSDVVVTEIAYRDPTVSKIVSILEENAETIGKEYLLYSEVCGDDYLATGEEEGGGDHKVMTEKKKTKKIQYEFFKDKNVTDDDSSKSESNENTLHHGTWSWRSYIKKGVHTTTKKAFNDHCPVTSDVLDNQLGSELFTGTPFGYAFFSSMAEGAKIDPHNGPTNVRLRIHLPILLPPSSESAGLIVGGVKINYHLNKAVVFDDSYAHEAFNEEGSGGERVVLLFDVWHPDVRKVEREGVCEMFAYAREQKWLK